MFRVTARTVLQLGAELISSDAVAFYELIKNAFDAGSPRVDIDLCIRLPYDAYQTHRRAVEAELMKEKAAARNAPKSVENPRFAEIQATVSRSIEPAGPHAAELKAEIAAATTWEELLEAVERSNYIDISDTGSGMSKRRLQDVYLTIGTRARLLEREQRAAVPENSEQRPILGEKGLGRLSAMRLGWRLEVRTAETGEAHWNLLAINWAQFSHDSDALVEDIVIKPTTGPAKNVKECGTRLRISALKTRWSKPALEDVAAAEFSRFSDPFEQKKTRFPMSLRYNADVVDVPRFDRVLLDHAHAHGNAELRFDKQGLPELVGHISYSLRRKEKTFRLVSTELCSVTSSTPELLRSLGPLRVWFYWFNRRALSAVDGIGDKRRMQALVNRWSGGLMVYRDGFRVKPYGGPDDDWLSLDTKALASSGYKVNRNQIIGKVDITSAKNPALTDQTNREGLRDCEEKQALVVLLKHVLEAQFRTFINNVDQEVRARVSVTFQDIHGRVDQESHKLDESVQALFERVPTLKKHPDLVEPLTESIKRIDAIMADAEELAASFEKGRAQVLNLASLGMMVEIVAHELNRATEHALSTLAETDLGAVNQKTTALIRTLETQLKTLQKRLMVLDPLSASGRQVKESFDLIKWVEQVMASHEAQFRRHAIDFEVRVEPSRPKNGMIVKMVKGMIVQILENFIANSVYWLKQERRLRKSFKGRIEVEIHPANQEIRFTDNGPGVEPTLKDEIFQPFVTTKPPGEGKGLGLYIAREIASYHKASVSMADIHTAHKDRFNTFILALGVKA